MHVRHEALFGWLMERFPETRLYGPYHHGGRSYYQWMARGTALVRDVLPLLEGELHAGLDGYAAERFEAMCTRYAAFIARERDAPRDVGLTGRVGARRIARSRGPRGGSGGALRAARRRRPAAP